ncbi:MAG: class I SAM-dependent methyltransferase [Acidobacteriota bacterium]|nr:class I SAM-dependent methyltransferase [Acidobacteriota bacterium]
MSVASHLGITLQNYDRQIRTLIPHYDEMLDAAASAVPPGTRRLLDLGIGTGALSARCLRVARHAHVAGVDEDADILAMAKARLGRRATLIHGNFVPAALPRTDAIVASFALHHVAARATKQALYRRIAGSLVRRGMFVLADCCPARDPDLAAAQHAQWRAHLQAHYSAAQARAFLDAWKGEDTYMPLETELEMMRKAGLTPEIVWRRDAFAVVAARKR